MKLCREIGQRLPWLRTQAENARISGTGRNSYWFTQDTDTSLRLPTQGCDEGRTAALAADGWSLCIFDGALVQFVDFAVHNAVALVGSESWLVARSSTIPAGRS